MIATRATYKGGRIRIGLFGRPGADDLVRLFVSDHGGQRPGVQMPMDYLFTNVKSLSAAEYRAQIAAVESTGGWPVYVISNHDIPRPVSRYGDGRHDDAIAKLLAGLYLTLRGTAIMYYGEELGMTNTDPTRSEEVKDPIGRLGCPQEKGRYGERTPMQWTAGTNAGFTRGTPWLPVPSSATQHNVASELTDPDSVLSFYRRLLRLRHTNRALLDGNYVALNETDPNVLSFAREYRHRAVLVLLNMSATQQLAEAGVPGFPQGRMKALLHTPGVDESPSAQQRLNLPPFAVYIGQIGN
jgi:alpha-glucosidase